MDFIKIEHLGSVAIVSINRQDKLNALCRQLISEIGEAFKRLDQDASIKAIVLRGEGKGFCAGADLTELRELDIRSAESFAFNGWENFSHIWRCRKPVIAAIHGFAMGGGNELAMVCDVRIAAESAKFGQPETRLGLMPGFGGTQVLAALVGISHARELIYTGRTIQADEAMEIGLVDMIVKDEDLFDYAIELASVIAKNGPEGNFSSKAATNITFEAMEDGLKQERRLFAKCFSTGQPREGIAAFLEKREPKFE